MGKQLGLDQLYTPTDHKIDVDIVFVHGLFGDRYETWSKKRSKRKGLDDESPKPTSVKKRRSIAQFFSRRSHERVSRSQTPDLLEPSADSTDSSRVPSPASSPVREPEYPTNNIILWPRDLLPLEVPNSRIFTWGYDVDVVQLTSSASSANILNHANTLLSNLCDVRQKAEEKARPLIFIAHSLGGIVVKYALNKSKQKQTYLKEILPATYGICFVGTPHMGSSWAKFAETVIGKTRYLGKHPNLQILRTLQHDSETLEQIHEGFIEMLAAIEPREIQIRSFQESASTYGAKIVPGFSSKYNHKSEIITQIPGSHIDMVKFSERSDTGFVEIKNALQRWTNAIQNEGGNDEQLLDLVLKDFYSTLSNPVRTSRVQEVEDAHPETVSWLWEHSNPFQEWLSQPKDHEHRLLWISGKPGSGKSTLMKHILEDERTMNSLQRSEPGEWIVIPYFFHDRGPDPIQKSFEGLLQEMLYQIIQRYGRAQEHLLRVRASKLLTQLQCDGFKVGNMAHCPPGGTVDNGTIDDMTTTMRRHRQAVPNALAALKGWSMGEVRNALREVFKHGANTLRICLLIDGLDENQEGRCEQQRGHQALVRYLQSLAYGATYPSCYIKMVLASRAEGIFREGFKERPGFAIHDYTKAAIYKYACRHVQSNNCGPLLELCSVLTEKAQGVFIWVKLVVEELIEGYIAGDTISQLRNTINSLPKEITELYQRVLERRKSTYSSETYVMLQLVLRALAPLILAQLMAATDANLLNGGDAMSAESMERRLASRCGGLLEVADGSQFSRSKAGNVQFSHQTVKSYVQHPETIRHIFRLGQEIPSEKASLLMLRYCLSMVGRPMDTNTIDQLQSKSGNLRYLFRYAAIEESCTSSGSASILTMLLRKARYSPALLAGNDAEPSTDKTEDPLARRRDALYVWASYCLRRDCPVRYETLQSHERKHVLLMLAAAHGLCKFLKENMEAHSVVDVPARCPILYGAICSTVVDTWGYGTNSQTVDLVTYLLDHGANPDAAYNNRTPLGYLLRWCTLPKAHDSSENTWKTILCVVELLLYRGANANALVGGGPESSLACLAIASKRHSARLLQSLVNHRADLSAQDTKGLRPLYQAVYYSNQEAVYVLLEAGANPCDMGNSIDALDRSTFAKEDLTFNRNMKKMHLFQSWTPGKLDEVLDRADSWESRNFSSETFSDMAI